MSENPMWKCPECGILQDGKTCIRCGMTNIRARIGELLLPKSPENQAIFEGALCEDWYALESRAEKAEAMVEKLIEAGNALDDAFDFARGIGEYEPDPEQLEWRAIVAGGEVMSEELRPCPFCKSNNTTLDYYEISCPQELGTIVVCNDCGASAKSIVDWNTRPIEDALNARIAELEAENERLSQLLHDEMSQLEIATDLGNKRWTALNKIYEHGEKHNTNWCKRKAQEGLGIKNA